MSAPLVTALLGQHGRLPPAERDGGGNPVAVGAVGSAGFVIST
jgi:hypothetical protein